MTAMLATHGCLSQSRSSEPRIHRLAFERKQSEDALVRKAQWFLADKSFEGLDTERKLTTDGYMCPMIQCASSSDNSEWA